MRIQTVDDQKTRQISPDAILFALLACIYLSMKFILTLPQVVPFDRASSSILLLIVGLYLFVDFIFAEQGDSFGYSQKIKIFLITISITILVIMPALVAILFRHSGSSELFVHDGLIQSEIATNYLLEGKNPYVENYVNTPMAAWWNEHEGDQVTLPVLYHYPYLPVTFLLPVPMQILFENLTGWFDQRIFQIVLFALMLFFLWKLDTSIKNRLMLYISLGMNPLLIPFFIEGRNDIQILFWFIFVILFVQEGKYGSSAIALAVASSSKQLAWFFVPFYFYWMVKQGQQRSSFLQLKKSLILFIITICILWLPWIAWDIKAFVSDVFLFPTGVDNSLFRIAGFGISSILPIISAGRFDPLNFPYWILQVTFGLPLFALFIHKMNRDLRFSTTLTCYCLWTFIFLFMSPSFNDNYFGFLLSVFVLTIFIDRPKGEIYRMVTL